MKIMINALFIFGIIFSVECGPINQKGAAFDPEQLMDRYMDMRTNQELFGSYHPNDLVQSIVDYFNHGGSQSINDNQWGLAVYNPNDKIGQYMGNIDVPGNLGPQMDKHNYNQANINPARGSAFNPNALNERLMQTAFSKGSEFSNFGKQPAKQATPTGQGYLGFDADALNRQMMESAMKKGTDNGATGQGKTTVANNSSSDEKTVQNPGQISENQMLGFNPDTLNAGLINSLHTHGNENGGNPIQNTDTPGTMMLGFNPDKLNAGLISSLGYSSSSVEGKLSASNGNGAVVGEMFHGVGSKSDHTLGQDNSSGSSPFTGMATTDGASGITGSNDKPGEQNTGSLSVGASKGSGNPLRSGAENGQSQKTNMASSSRSGPIQDLGEMNKGGMTSFEAGGIGSQGYGKQNLGAPPGVPTGSELKQTEATIAKAHGIGGMG